MLQFYDTHSHLYLPQFDNDTDAVIASAKKVLKGVFLPNIDLDSIPLMEKLNEKSPDFFHQMMGLHPCSVEPGFEAVLAKMEAALEKHAKSESPIYYGIGETGIDLHWDKTHFELQKEALAIQIAWAKKYRLPIILHCREALDIVIEIIEQAQDANLKGIFHCFDGNAAQATRISQIQGFKMGLGGVITYKKSQVPEAIKDIDLQHFVLETDSPYLPPTPHRGKRNESAYIPLIAQQLAEIKTVGLRDIAEITNKNAEEVFSFTEKV